jgi:hypothetical protein
MANTLPIFFIPVDPVDRAWTLQEVWQVIGDAHKREREKTGLRSSCSRGQWHIRNVLEAAAKLNSSSLDFLEQEFVCLDTLEVAKAIQALAAILAETSCGLTELATTCTAETNEFFLHEGRADIDANPQEAYIHAFQEAKPSYDVDWMGDAGYSASVGYFAFLKTLLLCLTECLNTRKYLLYYRAEA